MNCFAALIGIRSFRLDRLNTSENEGHTFCVLLPPNLVSRYGFSCLTTTTRQQFRSVSTRDKLGQAIEHCPPLTTRWGTISGG